MQKHIIQLTNQTKMIKNGKIIQIITSDQPEITEINQQSIKTKSIKIIIIKI